MSLLLRNYWMGGRLFHFSNDSWRGCRNIDERSGWSTTSATVSPMRRTNIVSKVISTLTVLQRCRQQVSTISCVSSNKRSDLAFRKLRSPIGISAGQQAKVRLIKGLRVVFLFFKWRNLNTLSHGSWISFMSCHEVHSEGLTFLAEWRTLLDKLITHNLGYFPEEDSNSGLPNGSTQCLPLG